MTKSDWFYPLSIKPDPNGTMVPILCCGHSWSAYQSLVFQNNISTSDLQTANIRANSLSKNEEWLYRKVVGIKGKMSWEGFCI